jgi:hypothetical protein
MILSYIHVCVMKSYKMVVDFEINSLLLFERKK